ncbi:hypothetical protein [Tabrizicola thermarum]|uniref:hypothetical protein n=1 Tax=Tabrizicola thermarum TaxID=2670345 RepID=UPI000FFC2313|nr:hypothetical protein [Tabrizicola thermarum]
MNAWPSDLWRRAQNVLAAGDGLARAFPSVADKTVWHLATGKTPPVCRTCNLTAKKVGTRRGMERCPGIGDVMEMSP